MNKQELIEKIKEKQPDFSYNIKARTEHFTEVLFKCLFDKDVPLETSLIELEQVFEEIVTIVCWDKAKRCHEIWNQYLHLFPEILDQLNQDAQFLENHDPAAKSLEEVYLCYPGFFATAVYRLSRPLYLKGLPLIPRLMTEYAHQLTGVDIHPGADIGCCFFIDHATGVVIGETTGQYQKLGKIGKK